MPWVRFQPMIAEPPPSPGNVTAAPDLRLGILFMLASMLFFVAMDALSKQLVLTQALLQVVWGLYMVQAVALCAVLAPRLPRLLKSQRPGLQALRALFLVATSVCFVTGLRYVPLAEAGAIAMLSPLAFTALAVPFLGERVGIRRWIGVGAGFLGAMIIIRPGSDAMQIAALFPLAAAVLHGFYQVVTRFISRDDGVLTTLTYSVLFCALIMTPVVPFHWTPLEPSHWALLAAAGACRSGRRIRPDTGPGSCTGGNHRSLYLFLSRMGRRCRAVPVRRTAGWMGRRRRRNDRRGRALRLVPRKVRPQDLSTRHHRRC